MGVVTTKTDNLCLKALELFIFDKNQYYVFRENQINSLKNLIVNFNDT